VPHSSKNAEQDSEYSLCNESIAICLSHIWRHFGIFATQAFVKNPSSQRGV
jgi:hypothetical protein